MLTRRVTSGRIGARVNEISLAKRLLVDWIVMEMMLFKRFLVAEMLLNLMLLLLLLMMVKMLLLLLRLGGSGGRGDRRRRRTRRRPLIRRGKVWIVGYVTAALHLDLI